MTGRECSNNTMRYIPPPLAKNKQRFYVFLFCRYHGQSENNIISLFAQALDKKPILVFLDECDSIAHQRGKEGSETRDSILNTLLIEMDKIRNDSDILFFSATNHPNTLDLAYLSRLNIKLEVPCPSLNDRLSMLTTRFEHIDVKELKKAAYEMESYSGRDIENVLLTASMFAQEKVYTSNCFINVKDDSDSLFDLYTPSDTGFEMTFYFPCNGVEIHN